jgi:hypothetical protein
VFEGRGNCGAALKVHYRKLLKEELIICTLRQIHDVPFKMQPNNYHIQKLSQNQVHPLVTDSFNLPSDTRIKVNLVDRPLLTLLAQKLRRYERVFILEHYFAPKSSAALREAFSNAYPDKEVLNKTTKHRLVTQFRDVGNVCFQKAGGNLLSSYSLSFL